jgi:hypothetical protein
MLTGKPGKLKVTVMTILSFFLMIGSCSLSAYATGESPLVGTWGAAILQYENAPHYWYVESTRTTFNADGSGSMLGFKNDEMNESGDQVKEIPETPFTYTISDNGDGSYTLSLMIGGDIYTRRAVISDNGNMILMDGTSDPAWVKSAVLVKIDVGKTYSNNDFSGDYFAMGYEHTSGTVNDPPDENGAYMAISSIESFNATDGNYNYKGRANSIKNDGSIILWDDSGFDSPRPYAVNSDGWVLIQEGAFRGHLTGNGAIGVGSGSYYSAEPNTRAEYLLMKKNDRAASGGYKNSDLEGTWVMSNFGDDKDEEGQSFSAGFGVMTCDASGSCVYTFNQQISGTTVPDFNEFQISVSADGSLGIAPDSLYSIPFGALGNDGNTVLFNVGLAFGDTSMRRIAVAIKASNAANVAGQRVFAESVHATIEGSAAYYGNFFVLDPSHNLSEVKVTGPDISGELTLVYMQKIGQWWTESKINYGETPPANKTYTIILTASSEAQMSVQKTINGGVEAFAVPSSPLGTITGDITFEFQGVYGADHYRISVAEGSDPAAGGEIKWISDSIYSDQDTISIPYSGVSLAPGAYNYTIHTFIGGNSSIVRSVFKIPSKAMPWMLMLLED